MSSTDQWVKGVMAEVKLTEFRIEYMTQAEKDAAGTECDMHGRDGFHGLPVAWLIYNSGSGQVKAKICESDVRYYNS